MFIARTWQRQRQIVTFIKGRGGGMAKMDPFSICHPPPPPHTSQNVGRSDRKFVRSSTLHTTYLSTLTLQNSTLTILHLSTLQTIPTSHPSTLHTTFPLTTQPSTLTTSHPSTLHSTYLSTLTPQNSTLTISHLSTLQTIPTSHPSTLHTTYLSPLNPPPHYPHNPLLLFYYC